MDLGALISSVRARATHKGISTAAPFLRELSGCLGGVCPSKILSNVSPEQWATHLKEAESRLVYGDDNMDLVGVWTRAQDGNALPPHTIASFPAIITTTRQDRDGDVLETKGADLDPSAPLLWQHLSTEPIGRLLAEGKRTSKSLSGLFSIASTALGQDAALLAEHGALRISHGFLPDEFEPLDEKDIYSGYRVLKFKILEVSLVSVPSNPDAVITNFSRDKLHHPLVKAWAGAKFDARPAQAAVRADVAALGDKTGCTCGAKSAAVEETKSKEADSMSKEEIASVINEHVAAALDKALAGHIVKAGFLPAKHMKALEKAMDHCATGMDHDDVTAHSAKCFKAAHAKIKSVKDAMSDTEEGQAVTPKGGRAFSAANAKKLKSAAGLYKAIADDDEAHKEVSALAHKGYASVKGLFGDSDGDDGAGDDYTQDDGNDMDPSGGKSQAHEKAGRAVSAENLKTINEAIEHGNGIKSHKEASADHKSMAKSAVKKLKSVVDSNKPASTDPDGDMSTGGGSADMADGTKPAAGSDGGKSLPIDSDPWAKAGEPMNDADAEREALGLLEALCI